MVTKRGSKDMTKTQFLYPGPSTPAQRGPGAFTRLELPGAGLRF